MQAFIRRHGQKTGRVEQMANRYIGARQESTQVNGVVYDRQTISRGQGREMIQVTGRRS